jgi:hypothetical protein
MIEAEGTSWDEVSDKFENLPDGQYMIRAATEPEVKENKAQNGTNLVCEWQVTEGPLTDPDPKWVGRKIRTFTSTKATTQIKRMALSAGVSIEGAGFDTSSLVGPDLKVAINSRVVPSRDGGEDRVFPNIQDFIPQGR